MGLRDLDGTETLEQLQEMYDEMDDILTYKGPLDGMNWEKVEEMLGIYYMLSGCFRGKEGVKVGYSLFRPTKRSGSVEVVGKRLPLDTPDMHDAFLEAVSRSDGFEVTAKVDGTVRLCFSFRHLM